MSAYLSVRMEPFSVWGDGMFSGDEWIELIYPEISGNLMRVCLDRKKHANYFCSSLSDGMVFRGVCHGVRESLFNCGDLSALL